MVDEPTRPGTGASGAPDQATIDSQTIGLADVIKASTAKHVVLLVTHAQNVHSALASNDTAAQSLTDAGFDMCSEDDPRRTYRTPTFDLVMYTEAEIQEKEAKRAKGAGGQLQEKVQAVLRAFKDIAKAKTAKIAIHLVGDHLVTAKEALKAARAQFKPKGKENKRKVEDLYLQAAKSKFHKGLLQSSNPTIKQMAEDIYSKHDDLGFPMALADFILAAGSRISDNDEAEAMDYAEKLLRKNNIAPNPDADKEQEILKSLATQIKNMATHVHELRTSGASDANSVKNALAALNGRRGLFIFGALHGMLANNPASLPDQLLAQDKDSSREIIATVDKANAGAFFNVMGGRQAKGELRPDIKVYDVEKKQVWASAQEWLADAAKPGFYNDKGLVVTSSTPAP